MIKIKVGYFLAGFMMCLMIAILFTKMNHPYTVMISYGNPERTERFAQFLDEKQVWYSYEINHLKRHFVKPHITDKEQINHLQDLFEAIQDDE